MGFFVNRAFNLVYVHAALQAVAGYGGEAFAFVFMLKAGIPAPVVLLAIGVMFGIRLLFRMLVLPLVRLVGLKFALVTAILAEAATYPVLSQIDGVGPLFYAYLTMWALSSSLYWTTYHAYVALLGDNQNRGAQVGAMEFVSMFMGIVAPAMTGALLTFTDPLIAFGVVGLCMAASSVPILLGPSVPVAARAEVPAADRRLARQILFFDGLRAGAFHFTWLIALFLTLGSSFGAYGGAMSLAGLAGAVAGLFIGKSIDLGNGLRAVRIGFALIGLGALARTLFYPSPVLAVAANAMVAVAWPIFATALAARIYTLARRSPCPLRFHIVAEGGWDMGTFVACVFSAAMIHMGLSYHLPIGLALVGCALEYLSVARTFRTPEPDPTNGAPA